MDKREIPMASILQEVLDIIKSYIKKISKEIPIKKAILFGSYAKGTYDNDSDIDLAIFSDYFNSMNRVDGTTFLLIQAMEYDLDLEPIAFIGKEYDDRLGIVDEIIRTGVEIPVYV